MNLSTLKCIILYKYKLRKSILNSTNKLDERSCLATLMIKVVKFKHDFAPMTSDGETIAQLITFKNDFKGFETIKDS